MAIVQFAKKRVEVEHETPLHVHSQSHRRQWAAVRAHAPPDR